MSKTSVYQNLWSLGKPSWIIHVLFDLASLIHQIFNIHSMSLIGCLNLRNGLHHLSGIFHHLSELFHQFLLSDLELDILLLTLAIKKAALRLLIQDQAFDLGYLVLEVVFHFFLHVVSDTADCGNSSLPVLTL
mgnify:CR=1 FL=1